MNLFDIRELSNHPRCIMSLNIKILEGFFFRCNWDVSVQTLQFETVTQNSELPCEVGNHLDLNSFCFCFLFVVFFFCFFACVLKLDLILENVPIRRSHFISQTEMLTKWRNHWDELVKLSSYVYRTMYKRAAATAFQLHWRVSHTCKMRESNKDGALHTMTPSGCRMLFYLNNFKLA